MGDIFREIDEELRHDHYAKLWQTWGKYVIAAAVALALIIWRGGATLLAGVLTVGVLAAFIQFAQRFFRPIQDLSEKYNLLQAAMASSERIFLLIDRESAIVDPPDPVPLEQPVRGEIEFQDGVQTWVNPRP